MKRRALELQANPRLLPQSSLGKAVNYFLNEYTAVVGYLRHGRFEIDNNLVENDVRPSVVGRKRWLFIGHPDAGWRSAVIYQVYVRSFAAGPGPHGAAGVGNLAGVRSFTGIVPKIDQSGLADHHGGLTKAGDPGLRQALYLAADVMLVTSLRDGMNLVAKEYVACRYDESGALVLSEFTGAADELSGAFLVNPHDIEGLKDAIVRAATISPADARRRMRLMRRRVCEHDVAHWARSFLGTLASGAGPA